MNVGIGTVGHAVPFLGIFVLKFSVLCLCSARFVKSLQNPAQSTVELSKLNIVPHTKIFSSSLPFCMLYNFYLESCSVD